MKKLISTLSLCGFLSLPALNVISCSSENSYKNTSGDRFFVLGDSLSDSGVIENASADAINNSWTQHLDLKKALSTVSSAIGNGLINDSIFKVIPSNLTTLYNLDQGHLDLNVDSRYYKTYNFLNNEGVEKHGVSFSDGDTVGSKLLKKFDKNITPAWDTNFEKLELYSDGKSHDILSGNVGNNYSVGGSTSHTPDKRKNGFFLDSIFYQAQALIHQHKNLSGSTVFLEIGGNDLLPRDYTKGNNINVSSDVLDYLLGKTISKKILDSPKLLPNETQTDGKNYLPDISDLKNIDLSKDTDTLNSSIGQLWETLSLLKKEGANVILGNAPDISEVPAKIQSLSNVSYGLARAKSASNIYNNYAEAVFKMVSNGDKNWKLFSIFNLLNEAISVKKTQTQDKKYWTQNSISESIDTKSLINNLLIKHSIEITANLNNEKPENKDDYVFWDTIHPNEWVYNLAYDKILKIIY